MEAAQQPLFSVLIANFNNGAYLQQAIESVLNQTYEHWEIKLLDDCSTDSSMNQLQKYQSMDRIRVYQNPENLGCGNTKRQVAALAEGELAGFLDPDDALHPNALEIMVKLHQSHPEKSLIYSTLYNCNAYLDIQSIPTWVGAIPPGSSNLHLDRISHFATFKTQAYRQTPGIAPELVRAVDKDLYYKLEEVGPTLFVNQPLYYYRIHTAGISTLKNRIKAMKWAFYVKKEAYLRRLGTPGAAPNISLLRLKRDYRQLQYKTARLAFQNRQWQHFLQAVKAFFFVSKKAVLHYPIPE